jgi:hypothetical protein
MMVDILDPDPDERWKSSNPVLDYLLVHKDGDDSAAVLIWLNPRWNRPHGPSAQRDDANKQFDKEFAPGTPYPAVRAAQIEPAVSPSSRPTALDFHRYIFCRSSLVKPRVTDGGSRRTTGGYFPVQLRHF